MQHWYILVGWPWLSMSNNNNDMFSDLSDTVLMVHSLQPIKKVQCDCPSWSVGVTGSDAPRADHIKIQHPLHYKLKNFVAHVERPQLPRKIEPVHRMFFSGIVMLIPTFQVYECFCYCYINNYFQTINFHSKVFGKYFATFWKIV